MTKVKLFLLLTLITVFTSGCSHALRITNKDNFFTPPPIPARESIKIGIMSGNSANKDDSRYVLAIIQSLQNQSGGMIEKVIYPFNPAVHQGQADMLLDISIAPKYSGKTSNFFVNWPGFLIWAPAIWGYGYQADINTTINIQNLKTTNAKQITVPTTFEFREAEIDRTWTELGWLEVSLIPFFGGFAFTQYDPDVTDDFITKVSPTYGPFVTSKILEAIPEVNGNKKPESQ
ncbi:MAG: hypothetical protein HY036_09845 [Nitrospirae bacterium]|nr:hypothetical protein [Nitrospirota bacterium]MBI3352867.1 hypothetical protein [Nitrospirota bacterium]